MESTILYQFARNNVYGSLCRALAGLQQNTHGLLAERRAVTPKPFANDAFFYVQVGMGRHAVAALEEFCKARLQGADYYEARRQLVANFTAHGGGPFADEDYALFKPASRPSMRGSKDHKREEMYRLRHLSEFRSALQVLDLYMRKNGMLSWPHEVLFDHIHSRLNSFVDPALADQGFDKFPVPTEVRYLADAVHWLKDRAVMGQISATFNVHINPERLPRIFAASSENNVADKIRYAHYAAHFQSLGQGLAGMITNGTYLQMLRDACPLAEDDLHTLIDYTADIPLDLTRVLTDFGNGYKEYFANNYQSRTNMNPAFAKDAVQAAQESVGDFLTDFVAQSAPPPLKARMRASAKPSLV